MTSLRFTTIAHAAHRYLAPLSTAKASWLIERLALSSGAHVLDIGCGHAGLLIDVVASRGAHGIGVDINRSFLDAADAAARERGVSQRVDLRCAPLLEAVGADEKFDAVLCIGSSQAVGTLADAMRWAHRALRDGGVALFGDGYWKRSPDAAYLAVLGATPDELATHAGNRALARDAGFRVLATAAANDDEWDDYESRYCEAMERWLDANPEDVEAPAFAARIDRWHDAYLRYGRDTLGFGYYVLMKPAGASGPS